MAETIKEFLVSLGIKVEGEQKFKDAIAGAEKGAIALGAAVAAAALAVSAATRRMAVDFDQLYFASARLKMSVGDIKSFSYAVSQMGGTAEGAMASLEGLTRKMRENPGTAKQIEAVTGARIRDGKVTVENLETMGRYFEKLTKENKRYVALGYAEGWGIDEKTMTAMIAGVGKFTDAYKKKMRDAGLDPEQAARDGQKFMEAWRSIWATLGVVVDGAVSKILGDSSSGLIAFSKWFDNNAGVISKALQDILAGFTSAFEGWQNGLGTIDWGDVGKEIGEFAKNVGKLVKMFVDLAKAIIDAVRALNEWGRTSGATKWLGRFMGMADHELDIDQGARERSKASEDASGIRDTSMNRAKRYGKYLLGMKLSPEEQAADNALKGGRSSAIPRGQKINDQQKKEMAAAIRKTAGDLGVKPEDIAGVMSFETGGTMHPQKRGGDGNRYRGLIQWSPENERKYLSKYGGIENATIAQQVEAAGQYLKDRGVKPGMGITGIYSAVLAGNAAERYWGRTDSNGTSPRSGAASILNSPHANALSALEKGGPKQIDSPRDPKYAGVTFGPKVPAWKAPLGGFDYAKSPYGSLSPEDLKKRFQVAPINSQNSWNSPVTNNNISQKVDIKVAGSTDPAAAAAEIGSRMKRVNQDLTRNLQGGAQ